MTNSKRNLNSILSLFAVVAIALSAGCTPWQLAKKTLFTELNEFPRVTDGRLAVKQYSKWAREEWHNYAAASPNSHSSDYIGGFIQGFTKYVHAGGNTDPPAVPPRRYWRVGYKNERGRAAIQDWYNGYAHGTQVANEKGYRERATLPSSMLLGYNREVEPAWENNNEDRSQTSHSDTQQSPLSVINEPTLANPADDPTVEPLPDGIDRESHGESSLGDPFTDDDERLPDVPPIADETSEAGNATNGFGTEQPTLPPGSIPEFDGSEELEAGDFEESEAENVFGDEASAFQSTAPRQSPRASFEVEQTPPRPPWLSDSTPDNPPELFPIPNTNESIELPRPTASLASFTQITAEPPANPSRFSDQESFQSSLPPELRSSGEDTSSYSLPNAGYFDDPPAATPIPAKASATTDSAEKSSARAWKAR